MKYALNLDKDGRILSATFAAFAPCNAVLVEELPAGNIADYLYLNGNYEYSPLPAEEPVETVSQLDIIEAQVTYTAMMTNTLLEV